MRSSYIVIFLVSCSVLIYEVALTRIFSIALWYHFAFLVISIAMLGIGSAGSILSLTSVYSKNSVRKNPGNNNPGTALPEKDRVIVACLALATGISILVCYAVSNVIPFDPVRFSWDSFQLLYLGLYCLVLSIPFLFAGLLIAYMYTTHSEHSMPIYSSDLIGAASGAMIVVIALNIFSPEYAILCASMLCCMGTLISRKRLLLIISFLILLFNLILLSLHPDFIDIKISEYKNLSRFLKYPGALHIRTYHSSYSRLDVFKSPAIRFAPGLSLKYAQPLPDQLGLAIDGDRIDVVTRAQPHAQLQFLTYLPSSLAFEISKKNKVLIINPKGGLHVLMALYYGSKTIHKLEDNPLIPKVINDDYNDYSGKIYESHTWTGYGRTFFRMQAHTQRDTQKKNRLAYDLIDIPMMSTSVSGTFGISEDYRLTVEAFSEYIRHLKEDGILSISLYIIPPPRTEYKILTTVIKALENNNIDDVFQNIIAVRSWDSISIIVRKSAFTIKEIDYVKKFSQEKFFDIVYFPGIDERDTGQYIKSPTDDYRKGFRDIIDIKKRSSFVNNYLFDIHPVYDNNPFFHYFLRFVNSKAIYEVMDHNWLYFMNEGYLLPIIFIVILILCILIIIIPIIISRYYVKSILSITRSKKPLSIPPLLYFALLGVGFMFIEVSIIHKNILFFENPSYAVAITIIAILMSSGLGSMCASKFSWLMNPFSLLFLSLILSLYIIAQPLVTIVFPVMHYYARVPVMMLILLPLGFFMGIPFPLGMKLIGQKNRLLIPLAWVFNACMSVLAPVMTIMVSLMSGFDSVLWISVALYMIAFMTLKKYFF